MPIYLDNNATTQPLDKVVAAMEVCLREIWGNPSSPHGAGRRARAVVENSRRSVASLVGASSPGEIIFTSGGTESIQQVFHMWAWANKGKKGRIVVSAVEHDAVLQSAGRCAEDGHDLRRVGVDSKGQLDVDGLEEALRNAPPKALVSLMLANNETGVIFPIPMVAEICRRHRALLHVDAVQAVGKMRVDVEALGCDYLSLSAHKFHGPKGVGALYLRRGAPGGALIPGNQENGLRGGTENVPGIAGMGTAANAVGESLEPGILHMKALRDDLERGILQASPSCQVNGNGADRICNTTSIHFPGKNAADIVDQLTSRDICASAGAACSNGGSVSHVLVAMGFSAERANASVRFSVSSLNRADELAGVPKTIAEVVASTLTAYNVR